MLLPVRNMSVLKFESTSAAMTCKLNDFGAIIFCYATFLTTVGLTQNNLRIGCFGTAHLVYDSVVVITSAC